MKIKLNLSEFQCTSDADTAEVLADLNGGFFLLLGIPGFLS
jgi:hypothetical protein